MQAVSFNKAETSATPPTPMWEELVVSGVSPSMFRSELTAALCTLSSFFLLFTKLDIPKKKKNTHTSKGKKIRKDKPRIRRC